MNDKGQVVDSDGKVFMLNDEEVTLENVVSKEKMESTIEERVKRLRAEKGKADETIKTLKSQENKSDEVQQLLTESQDARDLLVDKLQTAEKEKATAKRDAEQGVQKQLQSQKDALEKAEADLKVSQKARERDRLTNRLLQVCGNRFKDAGRDVIPQLLGKHKREKKRNDEGEEVKGEFVDMFDVQYLDEDGKTTKTKPFFLEKAVDVFAAHPGNSHYRAETRRGGSGGSPFQKDLNTVDRDKMTSVDKIGKGIVEGQFSETGLDMEKANSP